MEYRRLGISGLTVPILSFGTRTFGNTGLCCEAWGQTNLADARRQIDICIDAGINMFDSADIYSHGAAENILGKVIKSRRSRVLISTKGTFRSGNGPNDIGSSRFHLTNAIHASLKRLQTDYIDLYQLHGFDAKTPVEETLSTLDQFVRQGKIRYVGCSNFSGWHLMKSLSITEKYGWPRYVAHQVYYSLIGRDYEWELMPLALDQGISAIVWSPLGWARLTGKIRRNTPVPKGCRLSSKSMAKAGPPVDNLLLFDIVDVLSDIAKEINKTVAQVAINWLMHRPTIANIIIGARNEPQLLENIGSMGWTLAPSQINRLNAASETKKPYPYWHQMRFVERNPLPL